MFLTHINKVPMLLWVEGFLGQWTAADCDVVKEATRGTVRGVDWAEESPTLGKQFSDCCGFHFGEICSSVNGSEMGKETHVIEFVCNYGKPFVLHQIQASP